VACALLLGAAPPARAGIITYSTTFGVDSEFGPYSGSLPQYNPAAYGPNVHLAEILLDLQAHAGGLVVATSLTGSEIDFTGNIAVHYGAQFSARSGTPYFTKDQNFSLFLAAPPNDFFVTGAGDSFALTQQQALGAPYIGPGTINVAPILNVSASGGPPGVEWGPVDWVMSGEATVTYYTTPEPSSLVLFGVGAAAVAAYGWRARRKPPA
jgi:hypothetical protein